MSSRRRPAVVLTALLVVLVSALSGCAGSRSGGRTLHVLAAASLTQTFTALAEDFEHQHPGVRVDLQFGPSSGLAAQIDQGSPADAFASASPTDMDRLAAKHDAESPKNFARNSLEIAVPPDDPGQVEALEDLAKPGLKVALCQAQVPCGVAAHQVLDRDGVEVKPATEEVDVKAVLTKVTSGEVDAGMVYVTDVRSAGDKVKGITIPPNRNASSTYPIAVLTHAQHPQLAREWVDEVLSSTGQARLAAAGFAKP